MSPKKVTFEPTPNPATLKFNLPIEVTEIGIEIKSALEAERSPLAAKIFGFPWTQSLFIGPNYVTITKQDWVEWKVLAQPLAGLIQEHLEKGEAIILDLKPLESDDSDVSDSDLIKSIKSLLNKEIRPVVALDGGDITFNKLEDDILYLNMMGACSGCPSSQATLKEGVEVRVRQMFPQIKEVVAV